MKIYIITIISIFWATAIFAQNTTYQYDNKNQLIKSENNSSTFEYSFDKLGNRSQYIINSQSSQQVDLLVQNIVLDAATINQGATVSLSCNVVNNGSNNAGGFYVKIYLATTATGTDNELESKFISSLAAGASSTQNLEITIPSDASIGNMYLVFFADASNLHAETDETNNKANEEVTIQEVSAADLQVQNQTLTPTSIVAGGNISISATVQNSGNQIAENFGVKCYLSLNPTFESHSDVELTAAAYQYTFINAGGSMAYSKTVAIPGNTLPGIYYLLLVADTENNVVEQNEENNVADATLTIIGLNSGGSTPTVSFSVDKQFIGAGTTVQFTDKTTDNPTSWQWSFSGGTPNFSTEQNPSITYESNGSFDVSLTTINQNGSNASTAQAYIKVGQSGIDWIWGRKLDATGILVKGSVADEDGNVYVVGQFTGSIEIGETTLSTGSMFITKIDKEGNYIWAKSDTKTAEDIAIGADGSLFVTGSLSYNIFVSKYNNDGDILWTKTAVCAGSSDMGKAVVVDASGNCYITGQYYGNNTSANSINFGGVVVSGEGYYNNIFVAKYDPSGNFLWAKTPQTFGGDGATGYDICIDEINQHVYVTGFFSGNIRISASDVATCVGYRDILVIGYSLGGGLPMLVNFGGNEESDNRQYEYGYAITSQGGYQYITGRFSKTASFGGETIISSGHSDMFVAKLNRGGVIWVKGAGSSASPDWGHDILVDNNNKIKVLGYCGANSYFMNQLVSNGGKFIAQYDSYGNFEKVDGVPGYANDENGSFCLSKSDNSFYLTDRLTTDYTFGPDVLTTGGIFVAKNGIYCPEINLKLKNSGFQDVCEGENRTLSINEEFEYYQWSNGETTKAIEVNQSGAYSLHIIDKNGCEGFSDTVSINVFNIPVATVTTNGTTTFCQGNTLELNANTGTDLNYRWLKDGVYLTNETTTTLIALESGDFQVEVNNQGYCPTLSSLISLVAEPTIANLSITASATNICKGTEVLFTANPENEGSTPTYQWQVNGINVGTSNNTFASTDLSNNDGISCIMIASATCISNNPVLSDTTTMMVIDLPTTNISGGATICNGESTDISIALTGVAPWDITYTDGTTPATVSTSDNPYILGTSTAGTYQITAVSDANCMGTDFGTSAIVSVNQLPTASLSNDTPLCEGGTTNILIALTGTAPWSITYTDGTTPTTVTTSDNPYVFSASTAGIYEVTAISDANCTGTDFGANATVTVNPLPISNFSYATDNLIATFTNTSQNADSYLWDFGDSNTSTEENPVHTYASASTYDVVLTATSNLCGDNVNTQSLTIIATGFENLANKYNIKIYPNPSTGIFTVEVDNLHAKKLTVEIVSANGSIVHSEKINNQSKIDFDLHILSGVYFIRIKTEKGLIMKKITINK